MEKCVSVVCLCYNHQHYVAEAIESVVCQTYSTLQIILIDDASTDGSQDEIEKLAARYPQIQTLLLPANVGNCKAFNFGLKLATGDFVIDFATDDVMLPDRIEKQVKFFQQQTPKVGVVFTNATYIDSSGAVLRNHYDYLFKKKLLTHVPVGNVFCDVLTTYFICSPTMMIRREVLERLHGYDENLVYEDFDFWVRASRNYDFAFLNEVLTRVRKSSRSMSTEWYEQGDKQLHSTYLVCVKALTLCKSNAEWQALRHRVMYEFKQSVFSENKTEAKLFLQVVKKLGNVSFKIYWFRVLSTLPLPWRWIRKKYYEMRYY